MKCKYCDNIADADAYPGVCQNCARVMTPVKYGAVKPRLPFSTNNLRRGAVGLILVVCVVYAAHISLKTFMSELTDSENTESADETGGAVTSNLIQPPETIGLSDETRSVVSNEAADIVDNGGDAAVARPVSPEAGSMPVISGRGVSSDQGASTLNGLETSNSLEMSGADMSAANDGSAKLEIKSAGLSSPGIASVYFDAYDADGSPITELSGENLTVTLGGQESGIINFSHVLHNYFKVEFVAPAPPESGQEWLDIKIDLNSLDYQGTVFGKYMNSSL
ncbi:MAG: hypothetical protein LBL35_05910 [Clostridiales bacterium]|jgi:hypothetical protein|nr:hypothetical protein [Clostridiales bacterium]